MAGKTTPYVPTYMKILSDAGVGVKKRYFMKGHVFARELRDAGFGRRSDHVRESLTGDAGLGLGSGGADQGVVYWYRERESDFPCGTELHFTLSPFAYWVRKGLDTNAFKGGPRDMIRAGQGYTSAFSGLPGDLKERIYAMGGERERTLLILNLSRLVFPSSKRALGKVVRGGRTLIGDIKGFIAGDVGRQRSKREDRLEMLDRVGETWGAVRDLPVGTARARLEQFQALDVNNFPRKWIEVVGIDPLTIQNYSDELVRK